MGFWSLWLVKVKKIARKHYRVKSKQPFSFSGKLERGFRRIGWIRLLDHHIRRTPLEQSVVLAEWIIGFEVTELQVIRRFEPNPSLIQVSDCAGDGPKPQRNQSDF